MSIDECAGSGCVPFKYFRNIPFDVCINFHKMLFFEIADESFA